ncbi:MAG TPA: hypothetical protein DD490_04345 [Acidobacteria bacterium]|nr:hypothetical protein [Acidobacteriota bacterium]
MRTIVAWVLSNLSALDGRGFVVQVAGPGAGLRERLEKAVRHHPCDVLFVHRDAEKEPKERRLKEIRAAAGTAGFPPFVPVVPVRMTEAWLLIDETAIRQAAGNPNGEAALPLPKVARLESVADPKGVLRTCLIEASEKTGRRLQQFERDLPERIQRVAELISDFSPLRQLPAFQDFEQEARRVVTNLLAAPGP